MKIIRFLPLLFPFLLIAQKPGEAEMQKAKAAYSDGNYQLWFDESVKAADKGHPDGLYYLALAYDPAYEGQLPLAKDKQLQKSFDYYKRSADAGNKDGAYMTAEMYRLGEGPAVDMNLAITYYKKAYELGHPNGLHAIYQLTPDKQKYIQYLRDNVAKNFYQSARDLAEIYIIGQDVPANIPEAMKWLELGEKNNHAGCLYVIGYLHRNGYKKGPDGAVTLFNEDANIPKAIEYYQKAAALGNVESMNNLAEMYLIGAEVPRDFVKSLDWFKKGCAAQDGYACYNCAYMIYNQYAGDEGDSYADYQQKSAQYGFDPVREKARLLFK